MTSDCKNAQSGSHKDTTHAHQPNTRDASLYTEHCIKHCVRGAWGHFEEYQAFGAIRLSGRDKLRLTTEQPRPAPNHEECLFHWPCRKLASAQQELISLRELRRRWGGASPAKTGSCIKDAAHGKLTLNGNQAFNLCRSLKETCMHTHLHTSYQ